MSTAFQAYEQRLATFAMRQAPRMGYTNEFSMLISSDAEDQYEYAAGLVFLGAFWMVFFVMWAFGLIVCKWLGSAQVGFMSGSAMKPPGPEAKRLIQKKQPIIIRSIFACCALFWIIFTIVFLAVGLGAISNFDAAMKTGSNEMNSALSTATSLSTSLQSMGSEAQIARNSLVSDLNNFCPNPIVPVAAPTAVISSPEDAPTSVQVIEVSPSVNAQFTSLFSNIATVTEIETTDEVSNQFTSLFSDIAVGTETTSPTTVPTSTPTRPPTLPPAAASTTSAFDDISSDITTAVTALTALDNFIDAELNDGDNGIADVQEMAAILFENADSSSNGATVAAIIFSFPWFVVPLVLIAAVASAYTTGKLLKPNMETIVSKYVMPSFVIMTAVSVVFTTVFVSYVVGTADFCSGGSINTPDQTMMDILVQRNVTSDQLLYNAIGHYVSQCTEGAPFVFLDTFQTDLSTATDALSTLSTAMTTEETSIEALVAVCGSQVEGVDSLIASMESDLNELSTKVNEATALLECTNLVPIYTKLVYDTACSTTVHGLWVAYISFLIMSLTGMTMISLRTAYLTMDGDVKSKSRGDIETGGDSATLAAAGEDDSDSDADDDDSDEDDSDDDSDQDSGDDSDGDESDKDSDDEDSGEDSDEDSDEGSDEDSDEDSGDDSDAS